MLCASEFSPLLDGQVRLDPGSFVPVRRYRDPRLVIGEQWRLVGCATLSFATDHCNLLTPPRAPELRTNPYHHGPVARAGRSEGRRAALHVVGMLTVSLRLRLRLRRRILSSSTVTDGAAQAGLASLWQDAAKRYFLGQGALYVAIAVSGLASFPFSAKMTSAFNGNPPFGHFVGRVP